jgi:methyl-accepting chemotaxis protein
MDEVRDQNLEVVRQIGVELSHALDDARESAEQAERGFVEATSLLTTVRELQRLESELARALDPVVLGTEPREADEMVSEFITAARGAIEELVRASTESVEHLAASLTRVHEVAEQVRVLSNRATLIALDTAVATSGGATPGPELALEMRQLAREVQEATARTTRLSGEVERESSSAMTIMRDVRERVAERLERVPAQSAATGGTRRGNDDATRLLERMREMIQDATQKSERLSSAGERVSRAADRLVRDIEDERGELAGLERRLKPPEMGEDPEPTATSAPEIAPRTPGLRLLGQEHIVQEESGGETPGLSEERP